MSTVKLLSENPDMGDAAPPQTKRVHVVKPPDAGDGGAGSVDGTGGTGGTDGTDGEVRPAALQIEYTSTRVVAGALARLQRTQGILRADRSELSETFKMLRSQLLQRMRADAHSLLAVTSPRRIAGKSLVAVNLALALAAELDSTVLLVDADLSGQGLQTLFGIEGAPGLSEHLTEAVPISALLLNPGVERFVLLPAGGGGGTLRSAELLATRAAQHLFQELKQRYRDRYVVVDLPPLLDAADALAFLPQADTTLMVVEEHSTTIADMESVNELMAAFNLVGAVLTRQRPAAGAGRAARLPRATLSQTD